MAFRVEEDGFFAGAVRFQDVIVNNGAIDNAAIDSSADIDASKLQHQHRAGYSQELATAASTGSYVIHSFHGATGGVLAFKVGAAVKPAGDGTTTMTLKRGTTAILTASITLSSSSTNYAHVAGTISTSACTVGDVLVLSISSSTGTGGTVASGIFAYADVIEDYQ